MLPPSWKAEVQKAVEEAATGERDEREAQQNDASAKIAAAIDTLRNAQIAQTSSEDTNEKKNQAINKVTLILVAFTVFFTGLSWWAFRDQLGEMQKVYTPIKESADAAKTAADAAEDSVKAIRDQTRLDQRAWLGVESITPAPLFPEVGKPFSVVITFKNTGKTPARKVKSTGVGEPVPTGQQPGTNYGTESDAHNALLAPGAEGRMTLPFTKNPATGQIGPILQLGYDQIVAGTLVLHIRAKIDYEDIFGSPHWITVNAFFNAEEKGFRFGTSGNDSDDYQPQK